MLVKAWDWIVWSYLQINHFKIFLLLFSLSNFSHLNGVRLDCRISLNQIARFSSSRIPFLKRMVYTHRKKKQLRFDTIPSLTEWYRVNMNSSKQGRALRCILFPLSGQGSFFLFNIIIVIVVIISSSKIHQRATALHLSWWKKMR